MALTLYAHPFSSYCWKVLVPLWEKGLAFDYRDIGEASAASEWQALAPMGKMPLLVDDGAAISEATTIVEHLDLRFPETARMIPSDPVVALTVRWLDRMSDNYLMTPMQAIVGDALRPEAERDPAGVAQARGVLIRAYGWWDARMSAREWAADQFGLADCAAMPALFYADWVEPIPDCFSELRDYRARLLSRPSMAHAVDEARPFRAGFPLGDPGRD